MAIDARRDALVVVDVQNDFCPGGSLAVPEGDRVVPVLNRYIGRFAEAGAPIFVSRDWHPAQTKHFQAYGGVWPPHCVQGTAGAAFHAQLGLPGEALVVSKGMDPEQDAYSAFQAEDERGTPFASAIQTRGVRRLFVGGLATDYCVKATALDALALGYRAAVLTDAVAAVDLEPGDGDRALAELADAGVVLATADGR